MIIDQQLLIKLSLNAKIILSKYLNESTEINCFFICLFYFNKLSYFVLINLFNINFSRNISMRCLRYIKRRCSQQITCANILMIIVCLIIFIYLLSLIYFLIARHSQICPKNICRFSFQVIQIAFFVWRMLREDSAPNLMYDLKWAIITLGSMIFFSSLLQFILYLIFKKNSSNICQAGNNRFPNSQEDMLNIYFQIYIYSLIWLTISILGYIVVLIIHYRQEPDQEQEMPVQNHWSQDQIQQKLANNENAFSKEEIKEAECSICQADLQIYQNLIRLNCKHFFHKQCIMEWLIRSNAQRGTLSCPNCRQQLKK